MIDQYSYYNYYNKKSSLNKKRHALNSQIIDALPQLIGNKYLTEGFKSVCVKLKAHFPSPIGSYDHTIKLFDARVNKSAMTMDHGQPVESLLLYPSEGLLVSAGRKSCCRTNHTF